MTTSTPLSREARALLDDALQVDGPSRLDAQRSAARLTLALGLTLTANAAAAGTELAARGSLPLAGVKFAVWLKPVAVVALSAAAFTASVPSSQSRRDHAAPTVSQRVIGAPPARPVEEPLSAAPVASKEFSPSPPGSVEAQPVAAPPRRRRSEKPRLAAEAARLESARGALASGDRAGVFRELDAYEAEFPRGVLRATAVLLRARALCAAGRDAEARALAEDLEAREQNTLAVGAAASVCRRSEGP